MFVVKWCGQVRGCGQVVLEAIFITGTVPGIGIHGDWWCGVWR